MRSSSVTRRAARSLAIVAGLANALLPAIPAHAADRDVPYDTEAVARGTSSIRIGEQEGGTTRRVDLSIGKSLIIDLPTDAKEVFVANPKIANAVVRSTRKIFLIGQENGTTSMFVFDSAGRQVATLEVVVGRDLSTLRQTLRRTLPGAVVDIKPAGDSILLTGSVNSPAEAQQALDIATAFVGVTGGFFGGTKGAVINALTIKGKDQVMLRVSVVEIARSVMKQFGISGSGGWSTAKFTSSPYLPVNPQTVSENYTIKGTIGAGPFSIEAQLQAFERAGVSRVLAEPTLVAISGESAVFTAGGEIPVPSSRDCTTTTTGATSCVYGIEYKPFGVNLSFTPVVLSENRISLRITTEVSDIDSENSVSAGGIVAPGFKVRKSTTSVELPSGATIMTAGLLSQQNAQAVGGWPALMNLPILGALFRSRDYMRKETELMIMVMPMIAKAADPGQLARPDDGFVDSYDPQAILMGRLNKLYGTTGNPPPAGKYSGRFGFIAD